MFFLFFAPCCLCLKCCLFSTGSTKRDLSGPLPAAIPRSCFYGGPLIPCIVHSIFSLWSGLAHQRWMNFDASGYGIERTTGWQSRERITLISTCNERRVGSIRITRQLQEQVEKDWTIEYKKTSGARDSESKKRNHVLPSSYVHPSFIPASLGLLFPTFSFTISCLDSSSHVLLLFLTPKFPVPADALFLLTLSLWWST